MNAEILVGDCRDVLATLDAGSVQCCVTSPPYFALRSYLPDGHAAKAREIGAEPSVDAYVAALVDVCRGVRRVLRDDGTCWLNLGDGYAASGRQQVGRHDEHDAALVRRHAAYGSGRPKAATGGNERGWVVTDHGVKPKDLIGVPWRVAFALQADGWYLRSDIIWAKPNPMPESVRDRPTSAHEHVFLLSKRPRYFYDADAVREPSSPASEFGRPRPASPMPSAVGHHQSRLGTGSVGSAAGRNRRNVWTIAPRVFAGAHFATMPPALVEPCILAGTSERGACAACGAPWRRVVERRPWSSRPNSGAVRGSQPSMWRAPGGPQRGNMYVETTTTGWAPTCRCGTAATAPCLVLDPFAGAGTVGVVAVQHGRRFVGIELSEAYSLMARERIAGVQPRLPLAEAAD